MFFKGHKVCGLHRVGHHSLKAGNVRKEFESRVPSQTIVVIYLETTGCIAISKVGLKTCGRLE